MTAFEGITLKAACSCDFEWVVHWMMRQPLNYSWLVRRSQTNFDPSYNCNCYPWCKSLIVNVGGLGLKALLFFPLIGSFLSSDKQNICMHSGWYFWSPGECALFALFWLKNCSKKPLWVLSEWTITVNLPVDKQWGYAWFMFDESTKHASVHTAKVTSYHQMSIAKYFLDQPLCLVDNTMTVLSSP